MGSFFKYVIITFLFISLAQGASVASEFSGTNCSITDGYCSLRLQNFGSKIQELDVDDKVKMKEFKLSCDAIDDCFNSLRLCNRFSANSAIRAGDMIKAYCGVVNYLSHDFTSCASKLEAQKSECYDNWEPFLDESDLEDKKKMEESFNYFFGKDQCLKEEIIENCSQNEWEKFRNHFIQLDEDFLKQCNLNKMLD